MAREAWGAGAWAEGVYVCGSDVVHGRTVVWAWSCSDGGRGGGRGREREIGIEGKKGSSLMQLAPLLVQTFLFNDNFPFRTLLCLFLFLSFAHVAVRRSVEIKLCLTG